MQINIWVKHQDFYKKIRFITRTGIRLMKSFKIFVEEKLNVKTLSVDELAKLHGVEKSQIEDQLKKGTEIEKEHSTDEEIAKEIALDHLKELPDYYDRLEKMEKEGKAELNGGI